MVVELGTLRVRGGTWERRTDVTRKLWMIY